MKPIASKITKQLQDLGNSDIAAHSQRFFKTGKGEYGEGDTFLGIRVPVIRKCVKEYRDISLDDTLDLLKSPYHEARLMAVLILVAKYSSKKDETPKEDIYKAYLNHTKYINNWDIVDSSADRIVGAYLFKRDRKPIFHLIKSKSLWERRIGVMATFHFIKQGDFTDTLTVARMLLNDKEDLIHKAAGWMLREIGNRDVKTEEAFLDRHYKEMSRTMLRYAIEKFPESARQDYLKGKK